MTTRALAVILLGTTLTLASHPSLAQDKGKTKASELTSASQAALKQLYAKAPLAKELGPKAYAILVFPKVKGGSWASGQQDREDHPQVAETAAGIDAQSLSRASIRIA